MIIGMMPSVHEVVLTDVVVDIERSTARVGWGHTPPIYALVPTAMLLIDPNLPTDIAERPHTGWDGIEDHLSAIIQEDLTDDDIEQVLAYLTWSGTVPGAALTIECIIVPPEVEGKTSENPDEALVFISNHPL